MNRLKDELPHIPQNPKEGSTPLALLGLVIDPALRLHLSREVMGGQDQTLADEKKIMGIVTEETELLAGSPEGVGFVNLLKATMAETNFDEQSYVKGALFAHRVLRVHGQAYPVLDTDFVSGHVEELHVEAARANVDIHDIYRARRAQWQEENPDLYDTVADLAEIVNPIDSYDNGEEEEEYEYYEDSLLAGSIDIITAAQRHAELQRIRALVGK